MAWVIRPVDTAKAHRLVPLLEQVQAIHAAAHPDIFKAPSDPDALLAEIRQMLGQEGTTALLAVGEDGSSLGYAICGIRLIEPTPLIHGRKVGVLHHISVERACRRQGIGLALVEAAKARLREQGITRMQASYWAFNDASAGLMRKAGLAPSGLWTEGPL